MMNQKNDDDMKKGLVENFLREKARQTATRLIHDINQKAARDVDARLRQLSPEESTAEMPGGDQIRCGRAEDVGADLNSGLEALFERYFKLGMAALNRGDDSTATFYLGKCLLLPVSDDLKMRQMVRHNLRLAMSLRERRKNK